MLLVYISSLAVWPPCDLHIAALRAELYSSLTCLVAPACWTDQLKHNRPWNTIVCILFLYQNASKRSERSSRPHWKYMLGGHSVIHSGLPQQQHRYLLAAPSPYHLCWHLHPARLCLPGIADSAQLYSLESRSFNLLIGCLLKLWIPVLRELI